MDAVLDAAAIIAPVQPGTAQKTADTVKGMKKRVSHVRNLSGITSAVKKLPRESIKQNQFNFADIVGDISYINDHDQQPRRQTAVVKKSEPMQPKKQNDTEGDEVIVGVIIGSVSGFGMLLALVALLVKCRLRKKQKTTYPA